MVAKDIVLDGVVDVRAADTVNGGGGCGGSIYIHAGRTLFVC